MTLWEKIYGKEKYDDKYTDEWLSISIEKKLIIMLFDNNFLEDTGRYDLPQH